MGDRFTTLYGAAPARERPWHVGWKWGRDSYQVYPEDDEWALSNSWTCRKIVRPSYHQDTCVRMVVKIRGKGNGRGRCRPFRWSAFVTIGDLIRTAGGVSMACRSVADAMRQADRIDLSGPVQELLESAYGYRGAKCYWKQVAPSTDLDVGSYSGAWMPYLTEFPVSRIPWQRHAIGRYVVTHFSRGFGDDEPCVHGAMMERSGSCWSGWFSRSDGDARIIDELGVWYPTDAVTWRD